ADPLAVALGSVVLAWPRRSTKLLELRRSETIAQNSACHAGMTTILQKDDVFRGRTPHLPWESHPFCAIRSI
ncbi:hypothetical protein, partial [Achromobacter xylosoxidans]|uniref:hypothetical protein n=1 Tax=Alcaligenes xylosoxydans xylosoxydans TaxID=85698 RepID=UPI001A7E947D